MSAVTAMEIARVAYEARRAYAVALGEPAPPAWDEAPVDARREAILGAEAVLSGEARSGAHLHETWARRAESLPLAGPLPAGSLLPGSLPAGSLPLGSLPLGSLPCGYERLGLDERRKVLLFRAVVLAVIDGPCNGFCHDDKCASLEDHDCHLDTCLSKFGVPPGLWRSPPARPAPPASAPSKLYC
jgi:hypothetical protein